MRQKNSHMFVHIHINGYISVCTCVWLYGYGHVYENSTLLRLNKTGEKYTVCWLFSLHIHFHWPEEDSLLSVLSTTLPLSTHSSTLLEDYLIPSFLFWILKTVLLSSLSASYHVSYANEKTKASKRECL